MTPAEIAAGCEHRTVQRGDDGRYHACCVGCDIGAEGDTEAEALEKLAVIIKVEMTLAVEQQARDGQ